MTNPVAVAVFSDRLAADLARTALEAAGIYAIIGSDDAGRQNPGLDFSRGVAVLVRAEDLGAAREVLHVASDVRTPDRSGESG